EPQARQAARRPAGWFRRPDHRAGRCRGLNPASRRRRVAPPLPEVNTARGGAAYAVSMIWVRALVFLLSCLSGPAAAAEVAVHLFEREGCPHCALAAVELERQAGQG